MGTKPIIFLDDGGVMNDSHLRGQQWQRLVGDFFAPRLGGDSAAWAEANRIHMESVFEPASWQALARISFDDYDRFERVYWQNWIGSMCRIVGVATPQEEECIELARQAESSIVPRVQSALPGAIEAIRELSTCGYTLHTASGESSLHLHGYLTGMGVRECFGRLYGSDLVNTLKETPVYYERLFADLGIAPSDTLIVDDTPRVLAWARDLGAMTVLISAQGQDPDGIQSINSLAELPKLVRQ